MSKDILTIIRSWRCFMTSIGLRQQAVVVILGFLLLWPWTLNVVNVPLSLSSQGVMAGEIDPSTSAYFWLEASIESDKGENHLSLSILMAEALDGTATNSLMLEVFYDATRFQFVGKPAGESGTIIDEKEWGITTRQLNFTKVHHVVKEDQGRIVLLFADLNQDIILSSDEPLVTLEFQVSKANDPLALEASSFSLEPIKLYDSAFNSVIQAETVDLSASPSWSDSQLADDVDIADDTTLSEGAPITDGTSQNMLLILGLVLLGVALTLTGQYAYKRLKMICRP